MKRTHFHAIEARYLPPGNVRGARLRLFSHRFQDSVILGWNHSLTGVGEQGRAALEGLGYRIVAEAESVKGHLFLCDQAGDRWTGLKDAAKASRRAA